MSQSQGERIKAQVFGVDPDDVKAQIVADAESTVGRSLEQRAALMVALMETTASIWEGLGLTRAERRRRAEASACIDPSAARWWERIPESEREPGA